MTTLYALCAPGTREIRYVGKTVRDPKARLRNHISEANAPPRNRIHNHRHQWLRSLQACGLGPTIRPLVIVPDAFGAEMERRVIAQFKRKGYALVNGTEGGEGALGMRHRPESLALMRAAALGKKASPETRAKMRGIRRKLTPQECAARKGRKMPPRSLEWRAKCVARQTGRKLSPEWRAKIALGVRKIAGVRRRGWKLSPETRAKISAAQRGRVFSPEHRAKINAALRARARRNSDENALCASA